MNDEVNCSVVVAVRDEETHLAEALRSILRQERVQLELIVVDDHSSDSTFKVAQGLAGGDERLRLYRNPKKGKCSAYNFGVSMAGAPYVCLFAGDDIMPPGSLLTRIDAVSSLGTARPVFGLSKIRTLSENQRINGVVVPKAPGVGNASGASTLMNRLAVDRVFPVPEVLPNEDTWMALAALHLREITVVHSDVVACEWRVHPGNSSGNMSEGFEEYNKKIAERMEALPLFLEHFQASLGEAEVDAIGAKIQCEEMRRKGRILGVLASRASFVDRLRALSSTNSFFYGIRRTLYSTLSGR